MIFLYHSVVADNSPPARWCIGQALPAESFRRQVLWLSRAFQFLPLPEYLDERKKARRSIRRIAALTFDDGVGSTFRRVAPFLEENRVPATFFISTGHLQGGKLLWFCYLNALCFEDAYERISVEDLSLPLQTLEQRVFARRALETLARRGTDPGVFSEEMEKLYPLSDAVHEEYGGMTHADVSSAGASRNFEIGSHSVTHPFLSRQSPDRQSREILESRRVLSDLSGRQIRYFAYPAGDYDRGTLDLLRESGFEAGFATISRRIGSDETFELDRVGIYSPALWKVKLKAWGVATAARRLGVRVG
ncbi:MAG TPA: polysaccharide deacetylase family protein [Thermoanaerobaculia bacterium]|nr:polysaccharide deacetylase family protein [Thermoanaerobaculia bacterium]